MIPMCCLWNTSLHIVQCALMFWNLEPGCWSWQGVWVYKEQAVVWVGWRPSNWTVAVNLLSRTQSHPNQWILGRGHYCICHFSCLTAELKISLQVIHKLVSFTSLVRSLVHILVHFHVHFMINCKFSSSVTFAPLTALLFLCGRSSWHKTTERTSVHHGGTCLQHWQG